MTTTSIDDIRDNYRHGDGHWFDRCAMRFFNCRLPRYGFTTDDDTATFFVTSEAFDYRSPRLYSVRRYTWATKAIDTIGDFQEYPTRSKALTMAKFYAANPAKATEVTP